MKESEEEYSREGRISREKDLFTPSGEVMDDSELDEILIDQFEGSDSEEKEEDDISDARIIDDSES